MLNRYAAVGNYDYSVDMDNAWESIRQNIETSANDSLLHCELKQHELWFCRDCSKLLVQKKAC
jgi:hypothetical protein